MSSKTPYERYARDVAGMPVFAAEDPLTIIISPDAAKRAIPQDDEHCAIANACKDQLQAPYVSVGRISTDVALPHPKGVVKPGFGETKWAVVRHSNSPEAKVIIIATDTGTIDGKGAVIKLRPPRKSDRPDQKKKQNKRFRVPKGKNDGRGKHEDARKDVLTIMGVRNLTGQRLRRTA